MKPIKLTLCNFGPYKGEVMVDFRELNSSLYIIAGQTGAGKTYLFDGICYALYGKLSGDNRQTSDVICATTDYSKPTYVEFEFEYQGDTYKIHREPAQKYPSKRSAGEWTEKGASAYFEGSSLDKTLTKIGEVDKKIKEILCLDIDQFKMTMMIAQGDFYKLINAKTDDRRKIFRQILGTANLEKIANELKEMENRAYGEFADCNNAVTTLRKTLIIDDPELSEMVANDDYAYLSLEEPIHEFMNSIREKYVKAGNDEALLKKAYEDATAEFMAISENNNNLRKYTENKAIYDEYLARKPEYEEKAVRETLALTANMILEDSNRLDAAKKERAELAERSAQVGSEITGLTAKSADIDAEYKAAKEGYDGLGDIKVKIQSLKAAKESFASYKNACAEKAGLEAKIKEDNYALTALLSDKEEVETELKEAEDKASQVKNEYLEKSPAAVSAYNGSKESLERFKLLRSDVDSLIGLQSSLNVLNDQCRALEAELNEAEADCSHYRIRFMKSQAGVLAENLEEGTPCPVCGSLHHPQKATLEEAMSQSVLEGKEAIAKKANSDFQAALSKITETNAKANAAVSSLRKEYPDFDEKNPESSYEHELEARTDAFKDSEKEMESVNELRESVSLMAGRVDGIKSDINDIETEISAVKESISDGRIRLNKVNVLIDSVKDSVSAISGIDELDAEIAALEKNVQDVTDRFGKAANARDDALAGLSSLKALSEELVSRIDESDKEIGEMKNALDDLLQNKDVKSLDDARKYAMDEAELKAMSDSILKFNNELSVYEKINGIYVADGYDKLTFINPDEAEKAKSEKEALHGEALKLCSDLRNVITNNDRILAQIEEERAKGRDLEKRYTTIKSLCSTVNGNITGKNVLKISFETYYQSLVFQQILDVASPKFYRMTNGKYQFVKGEALNRRSQSGLEVFVLDEQTGMTRAASSLSGGESFQASLALALSFSEVIQAKAGGIELNSMFIDEGFGTLDSEMLSTTKKTLLDVGESSNRSIGIISHVEELERSIPSKIIVTKTPEGSKIEIRND